MKQIYDVFLSYARADDEPFVAHLHEHLTLRGLKVWWDRRNMPSRALTFLQEIRDAIDSCGRLIAVVAPRSVRSEYVLAEWQWAELFSKAVVPILREGDYGLLPKELSRLHTLDFRDDDKFDTAFEELARVLTEPLPVSGPLRGVPRLPAHFVRPASALDELSARILADVNSPAPISSALQIIVLHGMGGAGKSSTAAALARSTQVRRAFPDGIVWLNFGSDAARSQGIMVLGHALGLEATLLADPDKSSALLSEALEERRCLIVADDIWTIEDIQPIANALGPRCRLLVTSRDASVATAITNVQWRLDEFTDAMSRQLLSSWVATPVDQLPDIASLLAKHCGHLPLALALCGAMIRDGMPWQDLLDALAEADLTFVGTLLLNYPHHNVFAALNVSFDFLRQRDPLAARRYRDLAVFPPTQPLPQRAVITFWRRAEYLSDRHARRLLMKLVRKSLVKLDGSDTEGTIVLHALQHDFLRALAQSELISMHAEWVETYSRVCGGSWASGPNDGYFFQRLLWHLTEAGRQNDASDLLFDMTWLESKIRYAGLYSLLTDFNFLPQDVDIRALHDALRLGGKGIAERPLEMGAQIRNRLMSTTDGRLRKLLEQPAGAVWLRTLLPTLSQASGPLLLSIKAHKGEVLTLAAVDGGKNILSVGSDGRVVVWDGVTGAPLRVLSEGAKIRASAASPRAAKWAVLARDGLEVIDTGTGTVVAQREVADTNITHLAISEDGGTVLYATFITASVWNIGTGQSYWLHSIVTSEGLASIEAVGFLPTDGTFITTESPPEGGEGTLRMWDPVTRLSNGTAPCAQRPIGLAISSDGTTVVSADGVLGARAIVTDLRSLHTTTVLKHESNYVNSVIFVAFSDDEGQIIAGTAQGELVVWDRETSMPVVSLRAHENSVSVVASLTGARVVTASGGVLKIWDRTRFDAMSKPVHDHPVSALAVSEDNLTVVCASLDSTVSVWSMLHGATMLCRLGCRQGALASIALSGGRSILATGAGDGRYNVEVRLWNLVDFSKLSEIRLDEDRALSIGITSDGARLIVGSLFEVHVYRLPEMIEEHAIKLGTPRGDYEVAAYSLAVSADDLAFVGLERGEIVVVDVRAGILRQRWKSHGSTVKFVGLLPDHRLISGSNDGSLKIWRRNGDLVQVLRGEGDSVLGGGVTCDGALAVTSSKAGVLTLWDLESVKIAATLTFDAPLWPCTITGDGRIVVVGDASGLVHFLAVERG